MTLRPVFLFAALSCLACGPSVKPAMQAATDQLLRSYAGGSTEGKPANYQPMRWEAGQWVAYKLTEADKPPSVTVMKVLGEEGGSWWLEFENQDHYTRSVMKMRYSKMPMTPEEAMEALQAVIMKSEDQPVQTFDFASHPMGAMMRRAMANTSFTPPTVSEESVEDVTVSAGTFKAAARFRTTVSVGPVTKTYEGWFHPAVPLNGGVRSVSSDGKVTSELIGYGRTGAKSAL